MILSDTAILEAMNRDEIVIEPFDLKALGGNSYDVHLSPYLKTYYARSQAECWYGPTGEHPVLDVRKHNATHDIVLPPEGGLLEPGQLYLASTIEYTETHAHVPVLDGKSSIGRLGLAIHVTAGFGDVGFCNHWTLEIVALCHPVWVVPGMPIGQLRYHEVAGKVRGSYARKPHAKYTTRSPFPLESMMYKNFQPPES